uniref:Uncharacterized protein AlNc14C92G5758 n=1 Tax=Albugo laibachii Nc14 TaxID=890382 RepID=F0WGN0_9STRA|nr:conserved hypothetical protein [Albugo laibachii Nc14]|eukprot:CCA20394.1 conserved hypothetical protein [Albugo laibachii Nc14]
MDGIIYIQKWNKRLLGDWQKRYIVFDEHGIWKEYAASKTNENNAVKPLQNTAKSRVLASAKSKMLKLRKFSARPLSKKPCSRSEMQSLPNDALVDISGSGMELLQTIYLADTVVKRLPFVVYGRYFVFRIKSLNHRILCGVKSVDEANQWMLSFERVQKVHPEINIRIKLSSTPLKLRRLLRRKSGPSSSSETNSTVIPGRDSCEPMLEDISSLLPTPLARFSQIDSKSLEKEHIVLSTQSRDELLSLLHTVDWNPQKHSAKLQKDFSKFETSVPKGSLLMAVDDLEIETLQDYTELAQIPMKIEFPAKLRFHVSPSREGMLQCQLCDSLTIQLKTIAHCRSGEQTWPQYTIEIREDVFVCVKVENENDEKSGKGASLHRFIPLGECTVKTLHESVIKRKWCFLLATSTYSILFEATCFIEMQDWVKTLYIAINIANGSLPSYETDQLNIMYSSNIETFGLPSYLEAWAQVCLDDEDDEDEDKLMCTDLNAVDELSILTGDHKLTGLLQFLQQHGRYVEALQLMNAQSQARISYWKECFAWAIKPVSSEEYTHLISLPLSHEDHIQLHKDIPRTVRWLSGSSGAPFIPEETTQSRLLVLERVLHAFLSQSRLEQTQFSAVLDQPTGFYMQGMNALAFISMQVIFDRYSYSYSNTDELTVYGFFSGLVREVLPQVFGNPSVVMSPSPSSENCSDLFTSLIQVSDVLQQIVASQLPDLYKILERSGMLPSLLSYKWFPTLFSDISLTAYHSQLQYDTLLAIWDVCFLLGIEGIFVVSLALFSIAETALLDAADFRGFQHGGDDVERISSAFLGILCSIEPSELIKSVCEILELCIHPILLRLRNSHRRRLVKHFQDLIE